MPTRLGRRMGPLNAPTRECAIEGYIDQIRATGGTWDYGEILGDHWLVKVQASAAVLTAIAAHERTIRLPKNRLDDTVADLTAVQKLALRNKLEALGYPLSEIREALGDDLVNKTLLDVLKFAARRRYKPRYDPGTDTIYHDGPEQWVKPVDVIDRMDQS